MKVLREVFGRAEAPVISAAEILDKNHQQQDDVQLKDDKGAVISLKEIEERMNEVARSLISLGVVAGNTICIRRLEYDDALVLYLAAEQIGVNVVHLEENRSISDQFQQLRPRLTVSGDDHSDLHTSLSGEFIVLKNGYTASERVVDWAAFTDLKRFASNWELERFRVISA